MSCMFTDNCPLCHYAQRAIVGDGRVGICSDERRGLFKHEVTVQYLLVNYTSIATKQQRIIY